MVAHSTSPARRRLKRLATALGSLLVTLIVVELGSSLALHWLPNATNLAPAEVRRELPLPRDGSPSIPDARLGTVNAPDYRNRWCSTNGLGLRNEAVSRTPDDDTLRILILGGSVAWGWAARGNDETIAAHLEAWLDTNRASIPDLRDRRVEVLNAGVVGHRAWQGATAYEDSWRQLRPDVVVSIDGVNEVFGAIYTRRTGPPPVAVADDRSAARSWLAHRVARLKIVRLWRRLAPGRLDRVRTPTPASVAAAYAAALDRIGLACADDDILFVPVLQPTLAVVGTKPMTAYEARLRDLNERLGDGVNAFFELCYYHFRAHFRALQTRGAGVLPVDASTMFERESGVLFVDACHLTHRARQILAHRIGRELAARWAEPTASCRSR